MKNSESKGNPCIKPINEIDRNSWEIKRKRRKIKRKFEEIKNRRKSRQHGRKTKENQEKIACELNQKMNSRNLLKS